jgi:L-aspartate oxidase
MTELLQTDVLIIGCGIAGATAALQLAEAGLDVTVITRAVEPAETNTYYAQGGIIYRSIDDSPDLLAKDILHAGAGHCNPRAVQILVRGRAAAAEAKCCSIASACHSIDPTAIRPWRAKAATRYRASRMRGRRHRQSDRDGADEDIAGGEPHSIAHRLYAIDLLTPSHHSRDRHAVYEPQSCVGAYLLDQDAGTVLRCIARQTILATGGLGQIYLNNTNPIGARGDGIAMAYRAGARGINMEFVQFHPTTFYHPGAPRFLITEAARGDGGRLVNAAGEPFMQLYDAEWKDLAPRDVVSRSIYHEMLTRDVPNVYLDLRRHPRPASGAPISIRIACVRHRPHARSGAGGAGRALLVRRRVGGRMGPQHYRAVICHWRSGLHRPAWRESSGQHFIA